MADHKALLQESQLLYFREKKFLKKFRVETDKISKKHSMGAQNGLPTGTTTVLKGLHNLKKL